MGEKIDFNNANIIYSNIEETNINNVNISSKNTGSGPATLKIVANAEDKFLRNLHIIFLSGKSDFRLLSSIFHYSVIVIEEIVLLVLLSGYFIIGATTVILYVIFYEKIYEELFTTWGKEKHKSTSDYKLKYQHLKLNLD
jgi:mRNA-degrading endonuclease HigB of HigAB toxin-antitoxin module